MSYPNNALHLVIGDDEFLADRTRQEIVHNLIQMVPPPNEVDVHRTKVGELTPGSLLEYTSPSLFGGDKIVVASHLEEANKDSAQLLLDTAVNPPEHVAFVVLYAGGQRNRDVVNKLKKIATVHEAAKLKPQERSRWVAAEFQRHGVRPTPDVIHILLESVGSDLRELASAVGQLVADTNGEVTAEAVRTYYQGVAEVSAFDIADLACAGQIRKAVASTRRALQIGVDPNAIAGSLSRKMRGIARLYGVRGRIDSNALARELGMPPFAVQKTANVARQWSGHALDQALVLLAELEAGLRGQGKEPEYAVEAAVRRIAELANL